MSIEYAKHIVQKGDCLYDIAKKFYGNGSEIGRIVEANSLRYPKPLRDGQILKIPEKKAFCNNECDCDPVQDCSVGY